MRQRPRLDDPRQASCGAGTVSSGPTGRWVSNGLPPRSAILLALTVTLTLAFVSHANEGETLDSATRGETSDRTAISDSSGLTRGDLGPRVASVGVTVDDLETSIGFFTGVLDFELVSETELVGSDVERLHGVFGARVRVARLRLGEEELELMDWLAPEGEPFPADSRANDIWFQHVAIVVRDMQLAYARLRKNRVRHASTGPQRLPDWNPVAGGIEAFYFRDPDGHFLELIRFPDGKGDPRWHQTGSRLFLGIDHTAIVVTDTDSSLRFYRDALGLRIVGTSENWGDEQEHLNNVFGARLRITALRGSSGPGVELLEYLAPGGGRPRPVNAAANDLQWWQIHLEEASCEEASARLQAARARRVSPDIVEFDPVRGVGRLGFTRGLMVADPDGHAIRIVQKGERNVPTQR